MLRQLVLPTGHVGLFGYGSLLLKSSMERTLGRPYADAPLPCRLTGWRRTWNSLYPNERFYYMAGGSRRYPRNILYLNITPAEGELNGLMYVISASELRDFDRREAVYERVDVAHALVDVAVTGGPAWAYVGKPPHLLRGAASPDEAAVRRSYISIVEEGLAELGDTFREAYVRSTDPPPTGSIIDDQVD